MTISINGPGVENLLNSVKFFMKGMTDVVTYIMSMFGLHFGPQGLVMLNIIIFAFLIYIISQQKALKYIVILVAILILVNIIGVPTLFSGK